MNVAAHALPADAGEPFEVPDRVRQIRTQVDWQEALPPRAQGAGWRAQLVVKRGLDVVMAAAAIVALLPACAIIAFAVKLTSRGPIFYEWRVLGRHARPFIGYKFRTMVVDADVLKVRFLADNEMHGPAFKLRNDPRVTPLGRWLRKYSIDELPQLWSVVKGDMSLVGPRPPSAEEFVQFEPWQWRKLSVTPGITCLWQVAGRSEINDFAEWAALDLEYIRRWNLWLDLRILLRTVPAVLSARGAY
ncbi:MAG TPA: sugar transferase [Longimicrobiales bacterium]|nr:sugar transferase [Longimicrobiales bacterium]